jgi:hypothetical protein
MTLGAKTSPNFFGSCCLHAKRLPIEVAEKRNYQVFLIFIATSHP